MTVYLPKIMNIGSSPADFLLSSARVEERNGRDHVYIWARGTLSGVFVVPRGDGVLLVQAMGLVHRSCPRCGEHGPEHEHD